MILAADPVAAAAPLGWHVALTGHEFSAVVTGGLLAAAGLYLAGAARVRRRHPRRPWPRRRTAAFLAGLLVVALATESAIGSYDDILFADHMVQHLLLLMVAPPLLVAGRPVTLLLHASRNPVHRWAVRAVRSRPVQVITHPVVATAAYAATVVGTHLTGLVELTLTHPLVHRGEHLLYLVVGFLFFLPLVGGEPIRWRLSAPLRLVVFLIAMPVDTFTGVALMQASREPFPAYAAVHRHWGPSLVDDIHLGGAIMWVGGDAIMLTLAVIVAFGWLRTATAATTVGAFLEEARSAALANRTGHRAASPDSAEALAAYNAHLAALAGRPPGQPGGAPERGHAGADGPAGPG